MSYDELHLNCRMAIRTALASLVKATTAPMAGLTLTGGVLARPTGSFLAEGYSAGDEVVLDAGWTLNTGVVYVSAVSALQLKLWSPDRTLLDEAPANAGLSVGLPIGQADENVHYDPLPGKPFFRESYKGGPETRQSIGPKARIRLDGLYMLQVMYPSNVGSAGLDRMSSAIRTVLYPGVQLSYGGQNLTIVSCSRLGSVPESDWASLPMSIRFFAHTITPQ